MEKAVELPIYELPIGGCSPKVLLTMAKSERLWALTCSAVLSPKWGHGPWAKAGS